MPHFDFAGEALEWVCFGRIKRLREEGEGWFLCFWEMDTTEYAL